MASTSFPTFCKILDPTATAGTWDPEREYPILQTDPLEWKVLLPDENGELRWISAETVTIVRVVYPPDIYRRLEMVEEIAVKVQHNMAAMVKALEAAGLLDVRKKGDEKKIIVPAHAGDAATEQALREGG